MADVTVKNKTLDRKETTLLFKDLNVGEFFIFKSTGILCQKSGKGSYVVPQTESTSGYDKCADSEVHRVTKVNIEFEV